MSRKFNLDDLDDEPPKCPHKECCSYGSRNECYTHCHVLCGNFIDWYENLSREQIRQIYFNRPKDI